MIPSPPGPGPAIRVLALMEARWVTGPAKNLIAFANHLRSPACAGPPRVDLSVATFCRPSTPAGPFLSALNAAGVPVYSVRERRAGDPFVVPRLLALVASLKPDIIQTHNSKSHFLLRVTGLSRRLPWIAFHHGFTATDFRDRLHNRVARWALRGAPHIVTVCRAFSFDLCRLGIPASRVLVRHNIVGPFVPPPAEDLAALRASLAISPDARVLLAVGRLSREKGHVDLLDAVALLRAAGHPAAIRVVIVGGGPERGELESRCRQPDLSGCVTFAGQQETVRPFYAISQLLVLPSHSEGSSNVVLEAMAAGLPIVATGVGGTTELLTDGENALLVPCRDPQALSRAIALLLDDPELARRLGQAAQTASRNYTPDAYAASLIGLYRAVLDAQAARTTI